LLDGRRTIYLDIEGPNKHNDDFVKYIHDQGNGMVKYTSYRTNGELINEWIEKK